MMRKLFLGAGLCLVSTAFSQDYLISWKGDTLFCEMPGNPKKEGLRPAADYTDGYRKIAVFIGQDSVKVVEAGQVRGYHRQKHGKNLLCDGYFESVLVPDGGGQFTTPEGKNEGQWYFMLLTQKGEYASLYKMLVWGRRLYTYYYVVKHGRTQTAPHGYIINTRSKAIKLLADDDIRDEMKEVIKNEKRYSRMVDEYNRLKAAAEKGKQVN